MPGCSVCTASRSALVVYCFLQHVELLGKCTLLNQGSDMMQTVCLETLSDNRPHLVKRNGRFILFCLAITLCSENKPVNTNQVCGRNELLTDSLVSS